ncbi:efflux RND transporter permease subunit [Thiolapillus sp.]
MVLAITACVRTVIRSDEIYVSARSTRLIAILMKAWHRFRPIMFTTLAAILAMIPLSRSVFFWPMAIAIMGGLLIATLLMLLFLPAAYTVWYKMTQGAERFAGIPG